MIQTETTKAKILLIEVPMDANAFKIQNFRSGLWLKQTDSKKLNGFDCKLPQGNWTILNTLDEVTEDEAATLMPTHYDFVTDEDYYWHKDEYGAVMTNTAKDCLHSLATSLGVQGKTIILYQLK